MVPSVIKLDNTKAHDVTPSLLSGTSAEYLSIKDQTEFPASSTAPWKPIPVPSALVTSIEEISDVLTARTFCSDAAPDCSVSACLLFVTITATATPTSTSIMMKGINKLFKDFIDYRFFLLLYTTTPAITKARGMAATRTKVRTVTVLLVTFVVSIE